MKFDGNQLQISYDLICKSNADQFYVWVEIEKESGELEKPVPLTKVGPIILTAKCWS
jgi:hypothetical protein